MNKAFYRVSSALVVIMLLFSFNMNALFAEEPSKELVNTQLSNSEISSKSIGAGQPSKEPGIFDVDLWILSSQTLNFLVLLIVLVKFLFKPIGKIIDDRREEIKVIRKKAESEALSAEELKQKYDRRILKIEEEAYLIRQQAILESNLKSEVIIKEARQKAEKIIEEGEMELFMERQTAWAQIREEVIQLTISATGKVVEESMNDELHRKIIANSIERMANDLPDFKTQ